MYSELKSAVGGGITRLVCPPDTDPVLDEPGLVKMLINKSIEFKKAIVTPLGALTRKLGGQHITEMGELFEAGCIGFSQANQPIRDNQLLLNAFQYASNFDFPICSVSLVCKVEIRNVLDKFQNFPKSKHNLFLLSRD